MAESIGKAVTVGSIVDGLNSFLPKKDQWRNFLIFAPNVWMKVK